MNNIEKKDLLTVNGGSEFSEAVFRFAGYLYAVHKKTIETLTELRENNVDNPLYRNF